jgi:hypothetical protein
MIWDTYFELEKLFEFYPHMFWSREVDFKHELVLKKHAFTLVLETYLENILKIVKIYKKKKCFTWE